MHRTEKGLILREAAYKDADIMLTVLTECDGKIPPRRAASAGKQQADRGNTVSRVFRIYVF